MVRVVLDLEPFSDDLRKSLGGPQVSAESSRSSPALDDLREICLLFFGKSAGRNMLRNRIQGFLSSITNETLPPLRCLPGHADLLSNLRWCQTLLEQCEGA